MTNQKRPKEYYITLAVVVFMLASASLYSFVIATCIPELATAGAMHRTIFSIPALALIGLALYIAIEEL